MQGAGQTLGHHGQATGPVASSKSGQRRNAITTPRQLALGISLRDSASLETFTPGGNTQAIAHLSDCARGSGEPFLYLWGGGGTGKSHLLQAACQLADSAERAAVYIPLEQAGAFTPEILADLENLDLVCLDDVHLIAGKKEWEQALFHLFNRLRDKGNSLIVSAEQSPHHLPLELPDLRSRLGWGLSYQLYPLDDEQKIQALVDGAGRRGLGMSDEAARYILRHASRDMATLQKLLDQLDRASLEAQRRLTIPFIKSHLEDFSAK